MTSRSTCTDSTRSDYREYPAPAPLAGHLLCLWTQAIGGSGDGVAQRVMPDGCIDIVLINDHAPIVVGPWTEPFIARLAPGSMIVGARWYPGRAPGLLGLPASALLNQSVPLRDVWSNAAAARFTRIADEPGLPARKSAIQGALLDRLARAKLLDGTIGAAIQWLAQHPHGRVEQLSQWLGISSRQLQRRFSAAVGYGPKQFQSVLRFQRLLHLASRRGDPQSLAQLALEGGYADQAHMTRELQRFSGRSPTMLLRSADSALRLSDLLDTTGDQHS